MTISIRFSSIHNTYYHYQQNMTPDNYKIKVLLRTEGFFRQRKNSRVISKMYSVTGSFNRYETGLGPPMGWQLAASFSMESVSGLCQTGGL